MRKIQKRIFGVLFVSVSLAVAAFAQINPPIAKTADDAEIAKKVKQAFDPSRKYDYKWADEIKPYGEKIIPHIEPYLNDPDESVRFQVMSLLNFIKEPASISLLAKAFFAIGDGFTQFRKRSFPAGGVVFI